MGNNVFIVAEMSCNHMGEFHRAIDIIDIAADCGADAVKISIDNPDGGITIDMKSPRFFIRKGLWAGKYLHELYRDTHTPWEWVPDLMSHAKDRDIELFATVSCKAGVALCEQYGMPRYKISSYEACDIPLIREVMKTGKPIIVSCGMDWHDAWDELQGYPASFLYCVSAYPADASQFDLNMLQDLDGISDHSSGNSISLAAVALGAEIVERHIMARINTHDDIPPDADFSLDKWEFWNMVDGIREIESAMMPKQFVAPVRQFCKSLFAVEDIEKGDRFTDKNVGVIRPGDGMHPREYFRVIGMVAKSDISKGTPISESML